jgi:hypothetical protein
MPSSVLLAILVGAGVLALMPALVRRYDTAVRGHAELRTSSMRVLLRERRRRTVPGQTPINPPSFLTGRVIGRATVPHALTPGDAESDALVRAALYRAARARAAADHTQPVAAVAPRTSGAFVDGAQLRQWRRYRRRRILFAFSLLSATLTLGAIMLSPGFWAGAAVSAVLTLAYVVRLRAAAASDRRALAAERARRHRAYEFVRVATRGTRLDEDAAARTAAWLASSARRRPSREVARVLALAGREAVQGDDGSWGVRRAAEPVRRPRRPLVQRPVVRPAVARTDDGEPTLPRAANS